MRDSHPSSHEKFTLSEMQEGILSRRTINRGGQFQVQKALYDLAWGEPTPVTQAAMSGVVLAEQAPITQNMAPGTINEGDVRQKIESIHMQASSQLNKDSHEHELAA